MHGAYQAATQRLTSREELLKMPVEAAEWQEVEGMVCRQCGEPAYVNPRSSEILGCASCGFSTYQTDGFFVPRSHSPHRDND